MYAKSLKGDLYIHSYILQWFDCSTIEPFVSDRRERERAKRSGGVEQPPHRSSEEQPPQMTHRAAKRAAPQVRRICSDVARTFQYSCCCNDLHVCNGLHLRHAAP